MSDIYMRIMMGVTGSNTVMSAIRGVTSALSGSSGLGGALAGIGLAAGGLALGLGVTAVKAASDFQSSLAKVQAYAGLTQQQTEAMGNSILQMAPQLGEAPVALANALYMVSSAGFKGAAGLTVLKYAGETAAASNSDATVVTKALVGSLNALGLSASSAGNVSDILNATVSQGLMTWNDYGAVIGKISGAVSVAGGSASMLQNNFVQLNSALDVYTNATVSAHQASQYLNADMNLLDGKTSTLVKNAKKLGVSFSETQFKSLSFAQQLQYLNTVTGGNHDKLVALLGGNSQVAASVQFLNNHYSTLKSTIANVSGSMQNGKTTQDKFAVAQQTLAFKAAQAGAAFQSLMITIGTALLPVISKIVGAVTPAITGFTNWLSSGNHLQNILNTVGSVIQHITGFIGGLVTGIANVVKFFQQNQVAAVALLVPLGALGGYFVFLAVSAVASFIAAAPAMIAGFITGAAAAWTMAAGVIAATWPFLLIGAAIGAVIAIVILLVTHWNQVVSFLKGVWDATVKGVQIGLQALGQFFSNIWSGITTGVGNFFSGLGSIVQKGLQLVLDYFELPFRIIGFLFNWLYQHNTYFQKLVDKIREIVSIGVAFLKRVWQNIVNEIVGLWQKLSGFAATAWNNVVKAIQIAWALVVGVVTSVWQKISSVFTNAWTNYISKPVASLWSNVTSAFGNAWNTISQKLSSLWSSISGWFGNLASQAIQWGANLISGFLKGVQNAISGIGKTLGNVGSSIASYLGFHSPTKEGPGRDADKWAPNLMAMYSKGLQAGIPQLQASLNMVMRPVVGTLSGGVVPTSGVARPATNITHAPSITINLSTMARSQSEVRNLVDLLEQELGRRMRSQTPSYNSANVF